MSTQAAPPDLKSRHRAMWASGDYPHMVDTFLVPVGERLAAACPIADGTRVLDVAAGTGNAAIPAAARGAKVTASDLTPELLDDGRRRAEAAGLELDWVVADAESLPFADASFDVVMSAIGVMFAPYHQVAADELVRVCRPGGTIALLSWTPEGMLGALFRTMGPFAPPPPPGAQPPPLWGSEEHLQALFGGRVELHTLERDVLEITAFDAAARLRRALQGPLRADDRRARPTPPAPGARRSSTTRWTGSATSGIAARPTGHASRRSTSWRSAPGAELLCGDPAAGILGCMAMSAAAASLQEGRLAMERGDWQAAREAFEAVLEDGESADAREGLGQALWFLGEVAEGIASRERAFEEHLRAGHCSDAARVAVWVSHQHLIAGRASAARGWLARSERALEGIEGCAGRGWVAVERARHSMSVDEQIGHARRAIEIARETGEDNLEVCALSVLGKAEVTAGHLDEGMRLLEEAMATAAAGRWRNVHTVAEAYCNLIEACAGVGEWDRAHEWCELVDRFAQQYGTAPLLASCRTIHADVLLAAGRWPEAEHALAGALETHSRYVPELGAPTVGTLAELRIRQGRLADAERLLAGSAEHPAALRALALLRLAEDRPGAAVALLERGLRGTEGNAVRATQLLAPLVDGRLACGDVQGAGVAADDLAELARSSGIRLIEARARLAAARVELAARARRRGRRVRAPGTRGVRRAGDAVRRRRGSVGARAGDRRRRAGRRLRRGARRACRLPRARRLTGDERRRGAPAGARQRRGRPPARRRRSDGARAGGARADRARDVQRAHRPGARHQREDRRPPREPHPDEAGREQPHGGGDARAARRALRCSQMATDVPQRELRNNTASLLRRVEAGERLRITVHGHPIAELVPVDRAPEFVPFGELVAGLQGLMRPDDPLDQELRELDEMPRDPFA